jgi:UDP-3-O-[3-hydroxymyristoyl] glucosamine N-acyltransferase
MNVSLRQVVDSLDELVDEVLGSQDIILYGVAPLADADVGKLTFANASTAELPPYSPGHRPAAIILSRAIAKNHPERQGITFILSPKPRLAMLRAIQAFFPPPIPFSGIHSSSVVAPSAIVDPSSAIGPNCFIGPDVTIGAGAVIFPNVTICCPATIGRGVKIFPGTVIGADGFGFERTQDGKAEEFPHIGSVELCDDVVIGANCCIDRGTLGKTYIGTRTKLDDFIHVAHNVRIGSDCLIAAKAMIAGSVLIGDGSYLGPSCAISNKITVGSRAFIAIGATVIKNVPDDEIVMGSPAEKQDNFRLMRAALKRLAGLETPSKA